MSGRHYLAKLLTRLSKIMTVPIVGPSARNARYIRVAGTMLIAVGLLMPLGAVTAGRLPMSEVLLAMGRAVFVLAGLILVSWFATGASDNYTKGVARVVVGLMLCVVVFFLLGTTIREVDSLKVFTRQMADLKQRMSANDSAFTQRLVNLSMDEILAADNLVAPEKRAAGRIALAKFRALIIERSATRRKASIELQQIIAAVPMEDIRNSARAGVNAHHAESAKWADEMDQAQLQLADAYGAILEWCEGQGKSLSVQDHQLRLSTSSQEAQLETLLVALRKAEQQENETVSRMQNVQRKAERGWPEIKLE